MDFIIGNNKSTQSATNTNISLFSLKCKSTNTFNKFFTVAQINNRTNSNSSNRVIQQYGRRIYLKTAGFYHFLGFCLIVKALGRFR